MFSCSSHLWLFILQLRVIVYDTALPDLRNTATVYVQVQRNLNGPIVIPSSVTITANQDEPVISWGYAVNVTDPDDVSLSNSFLLFKMAWQLHLIIKLWPTYLLISTDHLAFLSCCSQIEIMNSTCILLNVLYQFMYFDNFILYYYQGCKNFWEKCYLYSISGQTYMFNNCKYRFHGVLHNQSWYVSYLAKKEFNGRSKPKHKIWGKFSPLCFVLSILVPSLN